MKILISGYYGFGNLGDESLLSGLITALGAAGHQLSVLSNNPKQSSELHGIKSYHRYYGLIPAIVNADVVISGGGGLLQNKTSTRSLKYYLWVIKIAKLLRKKTIIFAQSIGPLDDEGMNLLKNSLSGVAVAVRDKISQDLLKKLNIESELFADSALLLKTTSAKKKNSVLFFPRAGYPDISDAAISLARSLEARNIELLLGAIHAAEDETEIARIRSNLADIKYQKTSTPKELIKLIAEQKYVVSARLHGLILAAVADTDYCGIVYDPKVEAFLDDSAASKFDLPLNQLALNRAVLDFMEPDKEKIEFLKARAQAGINWLLNEIETN